MYDSDDGIKKFTFDLEILLKLEYYYVCRATERSEILGGWGKWYSKAFEGAGFAPTYLLLLPNSGEGRARLLPLSPIPTVLTNLHGGGDVPVTFGGGNGGCLGAKGFEFGSNFDGTDWLPDPPFCSSPQSPSSTKRSIPADQFWYSIPKSEKLLPRKVIYIISRLNKCFE
jgi:hypothetical protein